MHLMADAAAILSCTMYDGNKGNSNFKIQIQRFNLIFQKESLYMSKVNTNAPCEHLLGNTQAHSEWNFIQLQGRKEFFYSPNPIESKNSLASSMTGNAVCLHSGCSSDGLETMTAITTVLVVVRIAEHQPETPPKKSKQIYNVFGTWYQWVTKSECSRFARCAKRYAVWVHSSSRVPLVVMTSVRQQRSVCDLASFCGRRHSSRILATQRRKACSESALTRQGWRGNGRAPSSGLVAGNMGYIFINAIVVAATLNAR